MDPARFEDELARIIRAFRSNNVDFQNATVGRWGTSPPLDVLATWQGSLAEKLEEREASMKTLLDRSTERITASANDARAQQEQMRAAILDGVARVNESTTRLIRRTSNWGDLLNTERFWMNVVIPLVASLLLAVSPLLHFVFPDLMV